MSGVPFLHFQERDTLKSAAGAPEFRMKLEPASKDGDGSKASTKQKKWGVELTHFARTPKEVGRTGSASRDSSSPVIYNPLLGSTKDAVRELLKKSSAHLFAPLREALSGPYRADRYSVDETPARAMTMPEHSI